MDWPRTLSGRPTHSSEIRVLAESDAVPKCDSEPLTDSDAVSNANSEQHVIPEPVSDCFSDSVALADAFS
jgi:hypothetical protein